MSCEVKESIKKAFSNISVRMNANSKNALSKNVSNMLKFSFIYESCNIISNQKINTYIWIPSWLLSPTQCWYNIVVMQRRKLIQDNWFDWKKTCLFFTAFRQISVLSYLVAWPHGFAGESKEGRASNIPRDRGVFITALAEC